MTTEPTHEQIRDAINLCVQFFGKKAENAGWHQQHPDNLPDIYKVYYEMARFALHGTENAEAIEGIRRGSQDDHLPNHKARDVELGDCGIRMFDLAYEFDIDLGQIIVDKMIYNEKRQDHSQSARDADGGKKV